MMRRISARSVCPGATAGLAAVVLLLAQGVTAQSVYAPLMYKDFRITAPQGFGDRQNSWAWSMAWYKGKLLVGTERAYQCVQSAAVHQVEPSAPYPPKDPDISCTPDPNDLPLQAEIWSFDPIQKVWTRVFQSPQDIPIPGTNKFVARDVGFRSMLVYQEPDGTDALYVGACSSVEIHPGVPGGRLLRSTDGVNYTAIPQTPGTFMGNLGNACFRGMLSFQNQFFAMAVNFKGQGTIIQSPTPWLGDNTFQQISSPTTPAYEIAVFNNNLYATLVDRNLGFSVVKTNATGPLPYTYKTIIQNGGYRTPGNPIALSMQVYKGSLYVGGDGVRRAVPLSQQGAELFRVNADDSWDLVAGQARSTPDGQKNPLSGLGVGFSWMFNQHMWRMAIYDDRLYVGTFDESSELRNEPNANILAPEFGSDLWWTQDGTYFTQTDQTGFGDLFNIGVRVMQSVPQVGFGLFVGTANPFYGLKIYQGIPSVFSGLARTPQGSFAVVTTPDAPEHVQIESGASGALLSWDPPPSGATRYRIFRRTYQTIHSAGSDEPLVVPGAFEEIGTTDQTIYQDSGAVQDGKYAYQIKADNGQGSLSGPSNLVIYPSAAPPVTFADMRQFLDRVVRSGGFVSRSAEQEFLSLLKQAREGAAQNQFGKLLELWAAIKNNGTQYFTNADAARDCELILSRLSKRAQLASARRLSPEALQGITPADGVIAAPAQPTTGPGGSNYPFAGVTVNGPYWANNRYTDNNVQYMIFEPAHPTPPNAPVILFLHGYAALTPVYYQEWINHMCRKGYIVVWPKYQAQVTSTFADFPKNAQAAWTDALYRLTNFTWEKHVKPKVGTNGTIQTIIVGHSFGGWIAAWLAGAAPKSVPSFPVPMALVMIEPASLGLLPPINYNGIYSKTTMLILSADQDNIACSRDGVSIFTNTPQVDATRKNYLFFNSDSTGTPPQLGTHYFPTTNGYNGDPGVDARDFFVTYKLSVAAADCVVYNSNCSYFIGNGSPEQVGMGVWSNGQAVRPMSYFPDPTKLPPIQGCSP